MGMAASQARFLGLTARKTNVEYQGQQVNQARTVLANESAGLFNDMMVLKVPTPPVVNDYYTKRYQFQGTTLGDVSVTSIQETTDPQYAGRTPPYYDTVLSYKQDVLKGGRDATTHPSIKVSGTAPNLVYEYDGKVLEATTANDADNIAALIKDLKYPAGQEFLVYNKSATEKYYIEKMEPEAGEDTYTANLNYASIAKVEAKAKGIATFGVDESSGRYTSINFAKVDASAEDYVTTGVDYDMSISQEYDELAYEQAMQNYNFSKMQYENELQVINAKTEKLQMQDRTLELKLRQLDTEQKALQTEMESVQKVIQKNVEVTFKTFA